MLPHDEILAIGNFMSDFFKQMITIDTGVIVLIFTLVEKVLTPEKVSKSVLNRILLILSLASLISSLLLAVNALVVISNRVIVLLQGVFVDRIVDPISLSGTIYLFFTGVLLFIILALKTILQTPKT
jgi:hypothetical protein